MMLQSVLTAEARERLARVSLVKPEVSRRVEDYLLKMARSGKISAQVRPGTPPLVWLSRLWYVPCT